MDYDKGRKFLYVEVLIYMYRILVAYILPYNKLRSDLEYIGFELNPYEPCVANRMVKYKQQTIRFHVDDIFSLHIDSKVN